jgi:hypothetical protein
MLLGFTALTRTPSPHAKVGERLGQVQQGRVDAATDGKRRAAGAPADTGDVDDASLRRRQVRPGCAAQADRAEELQRKAFLPGGIVEGEEIAARRRPGIVHDDIEATETRQRGVNERARSIGRRQIAGVRE